MTIRLEQRLALIGASGWLGRSIGPALLRKGVAGPGTLVCINRSGPSAQYADWPRLRWMSDVKEGIADADTVILSIRPQDFRDSRIDCRGKLVLSLMAGVSCNEIAEQTGARGIVRAMPNAAVEVLRSYSPWFATPDVTGEEKALVRSILGTVGTSDELESEEHLAAITAISGAGPAYAALLASALHAAAREAGLPSAIAARAVEAVVCDAPLLLRDGTDRSEDLVRTLIEYRGTTAAALSAARHSGFDAAVRAAVQAGTKHARFLSK